MQAVVDAPCPPQLEAARLKFYLCVCVCLCGLGLTEIGADGGEFRLAAAPQVRIPALSPLVYLTQIFIQPSAHSPALLSNLTLPLSLQVLVTLSLFFRHAPFIESRMMNEVRVRATNVCKSDTPSNCHSSCCIEGYDGWKREGRAFEMLFVCLTPKRAISNRCTSVF